jgi:hypothetical protein
VGRVRYGMVEGRDVCSYWYLGSPRTSDGMSWGWSEGGKCVDTPKWYWLTPVALYGLACIAQFVWFEGLMKQEVAGSGRLRQAVAGCRVRSPNRPNRQR